MMAGVAHAFARLIKPFALVIAPALWKKWDCRMPAAFAAVLLACYAPYLGVGWRVFGFLGGYGGGEGHGGGGGFFHVAPLPHLCGPVATARCVAALLLA